MTSAELHKGQLCCPWLLCRTEGVFLYSRALQRGHHLPDQCLGLHFTQCTVTDFHTARAFGAVLTALRNVQLHGSTQQTYTTLCVTDGLKPRYFHT